MAGSAAVLPLALASAGTALAQDDAAGAPPAGQPFSFDALTEDMRQRATQTYTPPQQLGGPLATLDYDDYQRIQFDPEAARWNDEASFFRLNAFAPGWLFKEPVSVFEIVDGTATPMQFSAQDFLFHPPLDEKIPSDLSLAGVAGIRLNAPLNRADTLDEVVAFLGASYFRALGRDNRYGLSARGLAVNTGLAAGEEFPRFSAFYLERPEPGATRIVLYATLDSTSVTGAFRFVISPGTETLMDVTARLFLRKDVEQLGIAPLTSMFLFGGVDKGDFDDFRPAVHDSEALVLVTGEDTLYRPLKNPERLSSSYLWAYNPKGFGLVQRNRTFEEYLDAQARYDLRPSLMIQPLGDWGEGSVRLVEIPSDLEGNDNIVAFWVPKTSFSAGSSFEMSYRMRWGMEPGYGQQELAKVLRSRAGHGGVAGVAPAKDRRKFVIDFAGGILSELPGDAEVTPSVIIDKGDIREIVLSKIEGTGAWRLVVEIAASDAELVEIKANLSGFGRQLSETWLYQWVIK
ncbi:glucan biosynthesis protein [Pseudooceanicola algae]|nr:glucan biosynthesis protein G [Pseudooceanicola algae]